MRLVKNLGTDRVIDLMLPLLKPGNELRCITPSFSLFAFAELKQALFALSRVQLVLPPEDTDVNLLGNQNDRSSRNQLQTRWLAKQCAQWIHDKVDVRQAPGPMKALLTNITALFRRRYIVPIQYPHTISIWSITTSESLDGLRQ